MDPYFIYGSDDQTKDWPDALEGHKKLHLSIILNFINLFGILIVLNFLWPSSLEQLALNCLL